MSANASVSPADAETGGRLCPLLAHSGRGNRADGCLLLGVKRTSRRSAKKANKYRHFLWALLPKIRPGKRWGSNQARPKNRAGLALVAGRLHLGAPIRETQRQRQGDWGLFRRRPRSKSRGRHSAPAAAARLIPFSFGADAQQRSAATFLVERIIPPPRHDAGERGRRWCVARAKNNIANEANNQPARSRAGEVKFPTPPLGRGAPELEKYLLPIAIT